MPDSDQRKTGIPVVGEMPWGTHICSFYQTTEDLLDTTVAYFEAGLQSNEFCLWAFTDPVDEQLARKALQRAIPGFDLFLTAGQIEILPGTEWYLDEDQLDPRRVVTGWSQKLSAALAKGYAGLRVSGSPIRLETYWKKFSEYEQALDRWLHGKKMIALCTYSLQASSTTDLLDVARVHRCTIVRRHGDWECLETAELKRTKQQIDRMNAALDILSRSIPGREALTPRERLIMVEIVRGFSGKEIARALGIAPRTVEFHRNNLLKKVGVKNTIDLVRKVLGE
jgi:DNA-binding CsgD family transcriptional regulator